MIPTLLDVMFPVVLIQVAYVAGFVAASVIQAKHHSGKPFCLWYYTVGFALIPLGYSVLAILHVIGSV
jgi:hypothetical protein